MTSFQPTVTYYVVGGALATMFLIWSLLRGKIRVGIFLHDRTKDPASYWIGFAIFFAFAMAMWFQALRMFWLSQP